MNQKRWQWLGIVVVLVLTLFASAPPSTYAQPRTVYFGETGHYVRGAFLSYWERNGGLALFGYPLTEEYIRSSDGKQVQYFERARMELRSDGVQASVDLGRLGAESLAARGLGFPRVAPVPNTPTQVYFNETGHRVRGAFLSYWQRNGGLASFGYPLSDEVRELLPDGVERTVQYFERARFELQGSSIRLGLLGVDLAPCQLRPGLPPNAAPAGPVAEGDSAACARIPNAVAKGRVYPDVSAPGTTLGFEAGNYLPNEFISLWLNLPDGTTRALPYQAIAESDGGLLIGFRTEAGDPEGTWSLVGQGTTSGRVVLAGFTLRR